MSSPNKYHARRTTGPAPGGGVRLYDSAAEARYAGLLALRLRAGEIDRWEAQVSVPLQIDGQLICTYICDFAVTLRDGTKQLHEVKGLETPVWRLKRKLLEATWLREHPEVHLRVIGPNSPTHRPRGTAK